MQSFQLMYDYCSIDGYEERNILEYFDGTWSDLQSYIKDLKKCGCYNIDACAMDDLESEVE